MIDRASSAGQQRIGEVPAGWPEGGGHLCGAGQTTAKVFDLVDGHVYDFVFVDPDRAGCDGDPMNNDCIRAFATAIIGKKDGPVLPLHITSLGGVRAG